MNINENSQELVNMITEASTIFLMAHKDLDLDAINSCIGIDYFLKKYKKKAYIIIDDKRKEPGVKKVLQNLDKKIKLIKSSKVINKKDSKSILIILDTNKAKLTQNSDIIKQFDKIINIDHHDKSIESIQSSLSIIDSSASSTCEMIIELIENNNIELNSYISTLLLGGIILDTNYFKSHSTAKTFYYSYRLMDNGAKMCDINEWLKQDIKDYKRRQKIISTVKVINDIAIAKGTQRSEYQKEEIAKTADSLLTFNKIKASFVIAKIDKNVVGISGRSNGSINVGKVLEQFNGGGSETEAAARIEDDNINNVIEELSKLIRNL
ncbi:MAG: DHH family phosphoesterase [Bacilli bacterium]|nr:DHH family phosphoesterase [Bacilli bacterium]